MIMRWKCGYFILFCLVVCALYTVPAFAAEWVLDPVYLEDSNPEDYLEADTIATASDATASNADYGIMLLSAHAPYDGSMSTSVVTYMSDVVQKLGNVHYVLFRSGQYQYRLYYTRDLVYSGSGNFSADQVDYILYDTRNYSWQSGSEYDFSLNAGSYMIYSDLGNYPMLGSSDTPAWLLVILGAAYFVFVILRSFFAPSKFTI